MVPFLSLSSLGEIEDDPGPFGNQGIEKRKRGLGTSEDHVILPFGYEQKYYSRASTTEDSNYSKPDLLRVKTPTSLKNIFNYIFTCVL